MAHDWKLTEYWSVYECAQEAAYHADEVMWQITAIIWTADSVLLGFVLDAIDKRHPWFLVVASIVGGVLTAFVARVCNVAQVAKTAGYGICQMIEQHAEFPAHLRLHTKIDESYPKAFGRKWVYGICIMFGVLWVLVLSLGLCLLHLSA